MMEAQSLLVFGGLATVVAVVLLGVSFVLGTSRGDPEKRSPYECGFDPFRDARHRFSVQFYLVAILFLIFDLEVTYLVPWAVTLRTVGAFGFWAMMVFLLVLTVGFVYEWRKGALEWG